MGCSEEVRARIKAEVLDFCSFGIYNKVKSLLVSEIIRIFATKRYRKDEQSTF